MYCGVLLQRLEYGMQRFLRQHYTVSVNEKKETMWTTLPAKDAK